MRIPIIGQHGQFGSVVRALKKIGFKHLSKDLEFGLSIPPTANIWNTAYLVICDRESGEIRIRHSMTFQGDSYYVQNMLSPSAYDGVSFETLMNNFSILIGEMHMQAQVAIWNLAIKRTKGVPDVETVPDTEVKN